MISIIVKHAYLLDQSHSSVERAGILAGVRVRLLQSDELFSLRGETLKLAMEEDRAKGLIPFFVYDIQPNENN